MPKFSQNIYKTIKLKVTENQIDWVIQIDVVKKITGWGESPLMTNRVNTCRFSFAEKGAGSSNVSFCLTFFDQFLNINMIKIF